jgi:hypothetical protein
MRVCAMDLAIQLLRNLTRARASTEMERTTHACNLHGSYYCLRVCNACRLRQRWIANWLSTINACCRLIAGHSDQTAQTHHGVRVVPVSSLLVVLVRSTLTHEQEQR